MSMLQRRFAILAVAAAALFGLALLSGCGGGDDGTGSDTAASTESGDGGGGEALDVGLSVGIGGIDDRGFNQLAAEGMEEAEAELGVDTEILTSATNTDYVPNLTALARDGNDLVIGIGFEMAEAIGTVAGQFPETKFAIIDIPQAEIPGKPKNVEGLIFNQQEGGFLAGYAGGLWAKENGSKAVAGMGGLEIPPVVSYLAGYEAGAKEADPSLEVLIGYSQTFTDVAKCKELALEQIQRGAEVLFGGGGACTLGMVDAAGEKGVEAIGIDADQLYLGPQMLTSALKNVNVSVTTVIEQVQDGEYKGGTDTVFDLANGGIGLGKFAPGNEKIEAQVEKMEERIVNGEGPEIPNTFPK